MPRFVATPVIVEAQQYLGDIAAWPEAFRLAVRRNLPGSTITIATADDVRPCKVMDWVVLGPCGFAVRSQADFEVSFAPVCPAAECDANAAVPSAKRK